MLQQPTTKCTNLSSSSGSGSVIELAGLKAYSHSKLAILLVSDGFGYESPNLRPYSHIRLKNKFAKDRGFEYAKQVIAALKSQGITKVGAAGFCWGAKVVVELTKSAYIQAAVLLHPSFTSLDDAKEVKVPMAVLGAEVDNHTPPELLRQFEEILISTKVKSFVKIFPGVVHGWAVRYKSED